MPNNLTRRHFLGSAAVGAAACRTEDQELSSESLPEGVLPARPLGRTGESPSILAMGCGSRLSMYQDEEHGVEALNLALDLGITYLDTAQSYGGGNSETWVGRVMAERRDEVFLATKVRVRDYDETLRATETSLLRLQTDRIDLLHVHSLGDEDDLQAIEAGSLRAILELRDEGVCRFIGITSHTYPDVLATALQRHDFDCTQMALNAAKQGRSRNSREAVATPPADSFEAVALPIAIEKNMGVLAMKATGQETLLGEGSGKSDIARLLQYVWSLPSVTAAVVGMPTLELLRENAAVARNFTPMSVGDMQEYSKEMSDANKHVLDRHFEAHVDV